MKQLLKYYKPLLTSLLMGLILFGIGGHTYALEQCVVGSVTDVSYMASALTHIMAWAWSIPAVIAGELMSNNLLYGQAVGLEHYFYQFWTLMKTISNFALVAIIVIFIGKIITKKEEVGSILRKQGWKLLISGVLINMSWFLMGGLIDLSSVMIAGVGQISNIFMSESVSSNPEDQRLYDQIALGIPGEITIDKCGCIKSEVKTNAGTRKWENLIEKRNNIAGPLIFLGAGIMKLHTYSMDVGCGSKAIGDLGKMTLQTIIQIILMIMFIAPLVVLAVFNLFRLIYIWGWIIFSPLIILYNLFEEELGLSLDNGIKDAISINNIIAGLFQPVLTVGALSIGMMLIMGLYKTVDYSNTKSLDQMSAGADFTEAKNGSTLNIDGDGKLGSITLIDAVIKDPDSTIGGGFGYLLISFATCFIMWMLVKMSFSMSTNTFSAMNFNPQEIMEKMNATFMKNTKMPNLGTGGPLGGVSLNEAVNLVDIGSKDNRIMKKIEEVGNKFTKSSQNRANQGLEDSGFGALIGMQDNGDLISKEDALKGFTATANIKDLGYDENLRKPISSLISTAKSQDNKKTFKVDRADRKSYKALQEWYDKQGKEAIKSMGIKVETIKPDGSKVEEDLKLGSFEEEFNKSSSYVGGLIEYLASGDKLKIDDGKIITKVKEKRISDIDFKSF